MSNTLTIPAVAPEKESTVSTVARVRNVVTKARARVAGGLIVAAVAVIGTVSPASATPSTDLTDGAGDTFVSSLRDYFTDHVMATALSFMALMVGVGILVSWVRKAAKAK